MCVRAVGDTWTLSATLARELALAEMSWLRSITGIFKGADEGWIPFYRRRREGIFEQAYAASHGWHRHLARHAESPAAALAQWRSMRWRRRAQTVAEASDVRARLRRPRLGWARSAENALCEWRGAVWADAATDRTQWWASRPEVVAWCMARYAVKV